MTTQKGDRVFVHVLDWKDSVLSLPKLDRPVKSATYFGTTKGVPFTADKDALTLRLDAAALDPLDTIVVLEFGK